ncbi:MAG: hypothetical protein IH880_00255 [Candidatus Marinimicrobia bacterium]|nr:hypothetical protein [Candidatus Neomarinimicrobiota bacterium]
MLLAVGIFFSRWSGWKNDVKAQIDVYKKLKKQLPEANENNLASRLLRLKIKNDKNESLKTHYEALSFQTGLTLRNAIFFIIEYDYIRDRGLNPAEPGPMLFLHKVKDYIEVIISKEFPGGT